MAVTNVISGVASLDISSFLSSLTTLQSAATRAAAAINTALSGASKATTATAAITGTAAATDKLSSSMGTAQRSVQQFDGTLTSADASLGAFQGQLNNVIKAGQQISSLGLQFGLVGAAIDGMMVKAVNAATQLDFWTKRAEAASGATTNLTTAMTGLPAGEFQAAIEGIANAVGAYKPEEVAQATYEWVSATGEQITSSQELATVGAAVQKVLEAGTIAGMDYSAAIKGVTNVEHEFGIATSDTSHVVDVLMNVTQQTNAEFGDMLSAFSYVGPLAHSAGISMEEVAAIIGDLSNVGMKGTRAGQAIGQMLTGLAHPSQQAQASLQKLLVTNNDLSGSWASILYNGGKFVGFTDTIVNGVMQQQGAIGLLHDALMKESSAQAEYDIKSLGSQNELRALVPLILNYKDGIEQTADGQKKANDIATAYQQQLQDTAEQGKLFDAQWGTISQSILVQWGSQMNRLREAVANFGVVAEQALLPFVKTIADIAEGIENWISTHNDLARTLATVLVAVGAVMSVGGAFLLILGRIVTSVGDLQLAFRAVTTVVGALIGTFGPLIPIILAVGLGIAALANYAKNTPELSQMFGNLVQSLKDLGSIGISALGTFISMVSALMKGDYQGAWNLLVSIAAGAVVGLGNVFSQLGTLVQYEIQNLVQWLNTTFGGLGTQFLQWGQNIITAFANGMQAAIQDAIIPAINAVIGTIANFLEGHSPAKEGPLSQVDQWGKAIMEAYVGGMKDANLQAVVDAGTMIADALKSQLDALGKSADWSIYQAQFTSLRDQVQKIVEAYASGQTVGQDMWNGIDAALGNYAKDLQAVIEATGELQNLQNQANGVQAQIDQKTAELLPYQEQQQGLQDQVNQNNFKKDTAQLQINSLEQQKTPYQDQIDNITVLKDNNTAKKNVLQAQKDDLQARIDQEEWAVQPIKDEIAQNTILSGLLKDKVATITDQKTVIDETIASINRQYQIEQQGLQDTIALLKDKLDQQKAINDLANQPLTDAANKAKDQLDTLKEKFQLQEEPLTQQIDMMKAAGDTAGAASLQKQLSMLQALHKAQLDPLQLAYDKANAQLDDQKRSQNEALMPVQAQYDQASGTAALNDANQKLATDQQINSLTEQKNALTDQQTTLNDQIRAYDATNRNLQEQVLLKTEDEQQLKDRQQAISLQISALDRSNTNYQLQIDALNQSIKGIDALEKPYKDIIAAMDLANANLQHQIQAIQLFKMDPIQNAIKDLQNQLKGLQLKITVDKASLDAAKQQLTLDNQVSQAGQQQGTMVNKNNPPGPDIPGGPNPADVASIPGSAGAGTPPSFNFHIDNPFAPIAKKLQDKIDSLTKTIDGATKSWSAFSTTLKQHGIGAAQGASVSVNPIIAGTAAYQLRGLLPRLGGVGAAMNAGGLDALIQPFKDLASYIGTNILGKYGSADATVADYIPEKIIPGRRFPDKIIPARRVPSRIVKGSRIPSYVRKGRTYPEKIMPDRIVPEQFYPQQIIPGAYYPDKITPGHWGPDTLIPGEEGTGLRGMLSKRFPSLKMADGIPDALLKNIGLGAPGDVFGDLLHRVPGLGKAGDAFGGVSKAFGSFADSGVGKVIGDIAGKLMDLSKSGVGKAFEAVGGAIAKIRDVAGPAMGVIEKLVGLFAKIPFLGQALKALPIIGDILMIVQAVQTARHAWETNWNGMRDALKAAWQDISPIFTMIGETLGSKDLDFGQKVGVVGTLLKDAFSALGTDLQPFVKKTFDQISKSIGDFFKNLGPTLKAFWKDYGQSWVEAIGGAFANLIGGLVNFILTNAVPWALQIIASFLHVVDGFVQGLDKGITSKASGGKSPLADWFGSMIQHLLDFIGANWQTWATGIGKGLWAVLTAAFELLKDIGKLLFDIFVDVGGFLLAGLQAGVQDAWNAFSTWITGLWNQFISSVKAFFGIQSPSTLFAEIGGNIVQGLQQGISNAWSGFTSWLGGKLDDFKSWLTGLFTGLFTFFDTTLPNWVGQMKEKFVTWFANTITMMEQDPASFLDKFTNWFIKHTFLGLFTLIDALTGGWVTEQYNKFVKWFGDTITKMAGDGANFLDKFTGWFLNSIITPLFHWVDEHTGGWATEQYQKLVTWWDGVVSYVTQNTGSADGNGFLGKIVAVVKAIFVGLWTWFSTFVQTDLFKNITTALSGVGDAIANAIGNSINGAVDNIKSKFDPVLSVAAGALAKLQGIWAQIGGGGPTPSGQGSASGGGPINGQQLWMQQSGKSAADWNNLDSGTKSLFNNQANKDNGAGGGWAPNGDGGKVTQVGQDMLSQGTGYLGSQSFDMLCEAWVETVFGQATGQDKPNWGATALDAWNNWNAKGMAIPGYPTAPGQLVYFNWAGDGHVGIYEGGGRFISALDNGVQDMAISDYLKYNADAGASLLGYVPAYAQGTDSASGGLSLVGEDGAELVNLPRGSRVSPNRNLGSSLESALSNVLLGLESTFQSLFNSLTTSFNALAASIAGLSRQPTQVTNNYNVYLTVDTAYMQSEQDAKQWANTLNQLRFQSGSGA